jgi:hypothetical protein
MSFGHLKLHGHFDIFFLDVNQSDLTTSLTTNHIYYMALHWDEFMVHDVSNPLVINAT